MPVTASVKVKGWVNYLGAGRLDIDTVPITNTTSTLYNISLILAAGNGTISFPLGMRGCVITLDPSQTTSKFLKGVAGDTGILISSSGLGGTFILSLAPTATSFVITNSGADTTPTKFQFF